MPATTLLARHRATCLECRHGFCTPATVLEAWVAAELATSEEK